MHKYSVHTSSEKKQLISSSYNNRVGNLNERARMPVDTSNEKDTYELDGSVYQVVGKGMSDRKLGPTERSSQQVSPSKKKSRF